MNLTLIQSFMADVTDTFGLKPRYDAAHHSVTVRSKSAWALLKNLGAGKSRTWGIHSEILQAGQHVTTAWIRAFFDDEAHFDPEGGD